MPVRAWRPRCSCPLSYLIEKAVGEPNKSVAHSEQAQLTLPPVDGAGFEPATFGILFPMLSADPHGFYTARTNLPTELPVLVSFLRHGYITKPSRIVNHSFLLFLFFGNFLFSTLKRRRQESHLNLVLVMDVIHSEHS